jgi:lipoate-protein ligase B
LSSLDCSYGGIDELANILNLDIEPYDTALELQRQLVAARRAGRVEDTLVLLEHPPVITLGRRGNESHILASRQWLADHGIQVRRVERGGDVTYHGPGQLVGYPVMDLRQHRQDVGWYVQSLEEVLIRTLSDFGIAAKRLPGNIGVWLDDSRKIAALGVRIEEWITYHGFALNVSTDVSYFGLIVPCGLAGKEVTSMQKVLGCTVNMAGVRERVSDNFSRVFDADLRRVALGDLLLPIKVDREYRPAVKSGTPV